MTPDLPLWRRLWASLPLAYKIAMLGLGTVMTALLAVMAITYVSAQESLKLQLERQVSRDLNVIEKWYQVRLEEMQLTSVWLVRRPEVNAALSVGRAAPASALLREEAGRLQVDFARLVDPQHRLLGTDGPGARFDPNGLISATLRRGEPVVSTERWTATDMSALSASARQGGLVRLVATPVGPAGAPTGVLLFGERLGAASRIPAQLTSMIGGGVALLDSQGDVAVASFPPLDGLRLPAAVRSGVTAGRYFFAEHDVAGRPYLFAFRPIQDHRGQPVGAFARGFPESEIGETLLRYAGGIFMLTAIALVVSLLAFFWLTRVLLFPLRRLARVSARLAEGDTVDLPREAPGRDEVAFLHSGVLNLAGRLAQSREELAEAAVKLDLEARALAERNAELGKLNAEKARLLAAIREHDAMRGHLIEKIISAQEDERKRVARELHDETGQSLTSLLVGLKFVESATDLVQMRERTNELRALTVRTLEEVHQMSVALRPAMLDDLGLIVAVRSLVKDFGAQHGIAATFEAAPFEGRLPPLWEVTLYRIVQEALTNTAKYARAGAVHVRFDVASGELVATIEDDGRGFDPDNVDKDGREHLGLLGMRERIALIGGEFRLESGPGRGTRIEARLPLSPAPAPAIATEGASHDG